MFKPRRQFFKDLKRNSSTSLCYRKAVCNRVYLTSNCDKITLVIYRVLYFCFPYLSTSAFEEVFLQWNKKQFLIKRIFNISIWNYIIALVIWSIQEKIIPVVRGSWKAATESNRPPDLRPTRIPTLIYYVLQY